MKDSEVDTAAVPVDPSIEYVAGNDMVAGGAALSGGYR